MDAAISKMKNKPPSKDRRQRKSTGEVIRLVEHNAIRYLKVPKNHRTPKPAVLDKRQFVQLQQKSQITSFEEKQRQLEEATKKREKEAAIIKSKSRELRKKLVEQQTSDKDRKLTKQEKEDAEKAEYLLKRANQLRFEQEDELKRCNALILATKCHAIRDAQVAEKRLIKKEINEYEKKMEEMMERERLRGLEDEEAKKKDEIQRKHEFIFDIIHQIQENQAALDREADAIEKEILASRMMTKAMEEEEEKEKKMELEMRKKRREEMMEINEQLKQLASVQREQSRLADLKIQEFMRRKAEEEARREEEQRRLRLLREKELVRMRAQQERASDEQACKDAILALQIQDEVEREWRKREKAAVLKEAAELEKLGKARATQIFDRRKCQAIEIIKEKEEFRKMAQVCQEEQEKETLNKLRRQKVIDEYRAVLLQQINERKEEEKKERQRIIEMGEAWTAEREERERKLKEIMMEKIDNVRLHNVPESYIREIERQLHLRTP